MEALKKATVKIIQIIFQKDTFAILKCELIESSDDFIMDNNNQFVIKGDIGHFTLGKEYTVLLEYSEHPKYGVQYNAQENASLAFDEELSREDNYYILTQITTKQQAQYIIQAYPNFVSLILQGEKDKINLNNIRNVGVQYFNKYREKILQNFSYLLLTKEFIGYKLTSKEFKEMQTYYGGTNKIVTELKEHPYKVLIQVLHRNWRSSDRLILKYHQQLQCSLERCEYVTYGLLMEYCQLGHTRIHFNKLKRIVADYDKNLIDLLHKTLDKSELFCYNRDCNWVSVVRYYLIEQRFVDFVYELLNHPETFEWLIDLEKYRGNYSTHLLTDAQLSLLQFVLQYRITILTGAAGTGKSESLKALITMLEDNDYGYVLLAPTGIAAKRMNYVTQRPTATIHYFCGANQILDDTVCVIDEVSMLNLEHIELLLQCCQSNALRLVLIGDDAQLSSIGPGNIFYDLLQWGLIPTITLTEVFRYGVGGIDTVATDIRNQKPFVTDTNKLLYEGNKTDIQYQFVPLNYDPLMQIIQNYQYLLEHYNYQDILILSPYNVGPLGTKKINIIIQQLLYRHRAGLGISSCNGENKCFKIGDRVINTHNTYKMEVCDEHYDIIKTKSVYNGEIGVVVELDHDNDGVIVDIDGDWIYYDRTTIKYLFLAYALSIHKVQGNQAKAIILITSSEHHRLLTNNLLYTAITRAQECIVHIGEGRIINNALTQHETVAKDTWLCDLLERKNSYGKDFN